MHVYMAHELQSVDVIHGASSGERGDDHIPSKGSAALTRTGDVGAESSGQDETLTCITDEI